MMMRVLEEEARDAAPVTIAHVSELSRSHGRNEQP
jgi:hypothetical protein